MDFVPAVKAALNKFATFSGRASRSEYWWFYLFTYLISVTGSVLTGLLPLFGLFFGLIILALVVPTLSVTVRRLHDTGKSGWWILLTSVAPTMLLIPVVFSAIAAGENALALTGILLTIPLLGLMVIVGYITLFVLMLLPGGKEANKYGESPLS